MMKNLRLILVLVPVFIHQYCATTERSGLSTGNNVTPSVPHSNRNKQAQSNLMHDMLWDTEGNQSQQDFRFILPKAWQTFCSLHFKLMTGSNFTSRHALQVFCRPEKGDNWSLASYRKWIVSLRKKFYRYLPRSIELSLAFVFQCVDRSAQLSLPLPVKALHLWYMSVDNCTITDQISEYNIQHYNLRDSLGVMEITNSVIMLDSENFLTKVKNYRNTSRDFYCGSEKLEKIVLRNNTKTFTQLKPQNMNQTFLNSFSMLNGTNNISGINDKQTTASNLTGQLPQNEDNMNEVFVQLTQDHLKATYRCIHKNLQYLEESYQTTMSRHYSHFMLENALYPRLQYLNMSHSGIVHMGPHMLDWRRYFPKMKYMDLSYNHIKYFSSLTDNGISTDSGGVLDLCHNNITTLTPDDLEALRLQSQTVLVDIRNNPIVCDCKLKRVIDLLSNGSIQLQEKYEYIKEMKCVSPVQQRGKPLNSLEEELCDLLKTTILSLPLVIISCLSILSLAVCIFTIHYRREIMILAFTRFHISLPCRKVYNSSDKKYDAFIAYSEQDSKWVIHTLLPRLENKQENSGPGLKLCIHHRDFPIGGCISDNILDKIKDSRHTVLILSNNFLKSHWCKYEFRAAFTQSLMEKKQHLIMILQDELDKSLIDVSLQRCLKTFTYVKTDDKLFWDKLIYALSDREKQKYNSLRYMYSCKTISSISQCSSATLTSGYNSDIGTNGYNNDIYSLGFTNETNGHSNDIGIGFTNDIDTNVYSNAIYFTGFNNDMSTDAHSNVISDTRNNNVNGINSPSNDIGTTGLASIGTIAYSNNNGTIGNNNVNGTNSHSNGICTTGFTNYNDSDTYSNDTSTISSPFQNGKIPFTVNASSNLNNLLGNGVIKSNEPLQAEEDYVSSLSADNGCQALDKIHEISSDTLDQSNDTENHSNTDNNNDGSLFKECNIIFDEKGSQYNDRSLMKAIAPWFKSWFSVSIEDDLPNKVTT